MRAAQRDDIRLDGAVAARAMPTHRIARRGVLLVPEGRQILGPLSVRENLELGRLAAARRPQALAKTDLETCSRCFRDSESAPTGRPAR